MGVSIPYLIPEYLLGVRKLMSYDPRPYIVVEQTRIKHKNGNKGRYPMLPALGYDVQPPQYPIKHNLNSIHIKQNTLALLIKDKI